MSVLSTIRQKLHEMTLMQKQIAQFILGHPEEVIKMSITKLAMVCDVKSESSIVRFYRTLGVSGSDQQSLPVLQCFDRPLGDQFLRARRVSRKSLHVQELLEDLPAE